MPKSRSFAALRMKRLTVRNDNADVFKMTRLTEDARRLKPLRREAL